METNIPFSEPDWRPLTSSSVGASPRSLAAWLLDKTSLTARLKKLCDDNLSIEIVSQRIQMPRPSEYELFCEYKGHRFLVRDVILIGSGSPWVYARSVLPEEILSGELSGLNQLGTNPLGAWLFSQPSLCRGKMQIALVQSKHMPVLNPKLASNSMWGRRSMFFVLDKPILVTEIFLPRFEAFLEKLI